MAKIIAKSDCTFKAHRIVKGDEVVGLPYDVWTQLHVLERHVQESRYLAGQAGYSPLPSLDGFKYRSAVEADLPVKPAPETPTIDAREKEAKRFLDELEQVDLTNDVNDMIRRYDELVRFVMEDEFVEGDQVARIDTKMLGDPLKLTLKELLGLFEEMVVQGVHLRFAPERAHTVVKDAAFRTAEEEYMEAEAADVDGDPEPWKYAMDEDLEADVERLKSIFMELGDDESEEI